MKWILSISTLLITITLQATSSFSSDQIQSLYEPRQAIIKAESEVAFWEQRILQTKNTQTSFLKKLATAHDHIFALTGAIEDLKKSEDLLTKVLKKEILNKPGVQRMLAENYITQHRFCEALDLLIEAHASGRDVEVADLMLFDVYMELGEDDLAWEHLDAISNKASFDYLVRRAKWEDKEGRLDRAIAFLETARTKAEESKNKTQLSWIYSNLGDFYGHNGDFDRSKEHFIKALEIDPSDWYSVKGLAWMAWSLHEDSEIAMNLLEEVLQYNASPSIGWLMAEIEREENNSNAKKIRDMVITTVSSPSYGSMYDHYLYENAIEKRQYDMSLEIAQRQVKERPTTEAYALLANALFHSGKKYQAIQIAHTHVLDQTYEPKSLLLIYPIYKEKPEIMKALKSELSQCRYELGVHDYQFLMEI